jgi:dipeptidyl aminopeptidase/acylaminoacyl peptidase
MPVPFGLWSSPITSEMLSEASVSFQELHCDSEYAYWTEVRPREKGRNALIRYKLKDQTFELFPYMNVKTRVHEYGGGAFMPSADHLIIYDDKTHTLYAKDATGDLIPLANDADKRFADFHMHPDGQSMVCVCEDHSNEPIVKNYLVQFDLKTRKNHILHDKADFYASPRISPDGRLLAFISWNFPFMPWEESTLSIAHLQNTEPLDIYDTVGASKESISQFCWISDHALVFSSDRSGYTNLYKWETGKEYPLYQMDADFSPPSWTLGKTHFKPISIQGKKAIICSYCEKGIDSLAILSLENGSLEKLPLPFTAVRTLDVQHDKHVFFIGGSPSIPLSVVHVNLEECSYEILSSSISVPTDLQAFLSSPELIITSSSLNGEEIYGFYYPPKNPIFSAQDEELPPLIVRCHGGPTGHVQPILNMETQFWTSRGFGLLDVNYRGSSGHGKQYREALNGKWGIIDVRDCHDLAHHLAKIKKANPRHLFIRGGSAGGFTALCSVYVFKDYLACTSLYGVTDLSLLAAETHKFEKYYLESLIGSYPKEKQLYQERSPINNSDKIASSVLFLHGQDDPIVPLNQAQNMHEQLKSRGLSAKLVVFPHESHGFRLASTIREALDTELSFYLEKMDLRIRQEL